MNPSNEPSTNEPRVDHGKIRLGHSLKDESPVSSALWVLLPILVILGLGALIWPG